MHTVGRIPSVQQRHAVTASLCSPGAKQTVGKGGVIFFFFSKTRFFLMMAHLFPYLSVCVGVAAIVSAQAAMRITFTTSAGTLEKHHEGVVWRWQAIKTSGGLLDDSL